MAKLNLIVTEAKSVLALDYLCEILQKRVTVALDQPPTLSNDERLYGLTYLTGPTSTASVKVWLGPYVDLIAAEQAHGVR